MTSRPDGSPWSGRPWQRGHAVAGGTATIVAIADGTVSMYVSKGGGVIGAGGHDAVWSTAVRLLETAGGAVPIPRIVDDPPTISPAGRVRITVRKLFDGMLSDEVAEDALQRGRHVLSPLYAAAQDVLTEVRLSTERREPKRSRRSASSGAEEVCVRPRAGHGA